MSTPLATGTPLPQELNDPVTRIEFEAALLRQEHRLLSILRNFFIRRREFSNGDPRRTAVAEALLW